MAKFMLFKDNVTAYIPYTRSFSWKHIHIYNMLEINYSLTIIKFMARMFILGQIMRYEIVVWPRVIFLGFNRTTWTMIFYLIPFYPLFGPLFDPLIYSWFKIIERRKLSSLKKSRRLKNRNLWGKHKRIVYIWELTNSPLMFITLIWHYW